MMSKGKAGNDDPGSRKLDVQIMQVMTLAALFVAWLIVAGHRRKRQLMHGSGPSDT